MKRNKIQPVVKKAQSPNIKSDSDTDIIEQPKSNKVTPTKQTVSSLSKAPTEQTANTNGSNNVEKPAKMPSVEEESKQSDVVVAGGNQSNEKKLLRSHSSKLKNLQFYLNKLQSNPNGDYIQNILVKWKGKFKLLETHHGYVQWLFPNFFQSRFNNGSDPLQKEEADEFIKDPVIAQRLRKAYDLIYEFFGMKIVNEVTGEVKRADNYKERYNETYITSYHNHMRIRRILTHFNNVGFRPYAVSLVKFLEKEIYGDIGYQRFMEDKRPATIKWQEIPNTVPLRSLARLKVFEEWSVYGEIDETNQLQVETLQDNCFATFDNIKRESAYLKGLKKI